MAKLSTTQRLHEDGRMPQEQYSMYFHVMTGIQIVFPSLRSTNADPKYWNLILDGQAKPNPANKTHSQNKFWIMIRVGVQGMNTLYVNNWFFQVKTHWKNQIYMSSIYNRNIYIHTQIIPVSCWMSKSSITWYWFNLNNHFLPKAHLPGVDPQRVQREPGRLCRSQTWTA